MPNNDAPLWPKKTRPTSKKKLIKSNESKMKPPIPNGVYLRKGKLPETAWLQGLHFLLAILHGTHPDATMMGSRIKPEDRQYTENRLACLFSYLAIYDTGTTINVLNSLLKILIYTVLTVLFGFNFHFKNEDWDERENRTICTQVFAWMYDVRAKHWMFDFSLG